MKLEEAVKANDPRVREAFEFRKLDFEELKNCKLSTSNVLSWKYNNQMDTGESLGYFNKDFTDFIINRHWSDRMRELTGTQIPVCCGFKMTGGGVGIFKSNEIAWQCSQCGHIVE